MNYPAARSGVSEDGNGMIMPLTLPSPAGGEGIASPRHKQRGIIRVELAKQDSEKYEFKKR